MCKFDELTSMGGNQVVVDIPDWLLPDKENRTLSIDSCIVDQIKALWDAGIYTLGCCCRHKGSKKKPEVIIGENYNRKNIERIVKILKKHDTRKWIILQWNLNVKHNGNFYVFSHGENL